MKYRCPICGHPMRELEHMRIQHTPAGVPEYKRGYPYSVVRSHTAVECENGHRLLYSDSKYRSMDAIFAWKT